MSTAITQEAIVDFLVAQGGRVKNSDLIGHFKHAFPEEPASRASVRDAFKKCVDNVAFVKAESGDKWVCLKKRYRVAKQQQSVRVGAEPGRTVSRCTVTPAEDGTSDSKDVGGPSRTVQLDGAGPGPHPAPRHPPCAILTVRDCATAASGTLPGSGYGHVGNEKESHVTCRSLVDKPRENETIAFTCVVDQVSNRAGEADVGISGSSEAVKRECDGGSCNQAPPVLKIPESVLKEPSPLYGTADGSRGSLFLKPNLTAAGSTSRAQGGAVSLRLPGPQLEDEEKRKTFTVAVIDSFPQVRCGAAPHSPSIDASTPSPSPSEDVGGASPSPSPSEDVGGASPPSDDVGGASPSNDVGGASLDPLEHQWMLACAAGDWEVLRRLLVRRPDLLPRRDFITGFSCLHWAARRGQAELLALLLGHARGRGGLDVDARASGGYTPLHLAAMHGHGQAVALLAGAYEANVHLRDYSGRRACQYLPPGTPHDLRDIAGGDDREGNVGDGSRPTAPRREGRLQRIQARASLMVHSASFSGPDRPGRSRPRPRPSSTLSG